MSRLTRPGWRLLAAIRRYGAGALVGLMAAACNPNTNRPYFPPVTGAAREEIFLDVGTATTVLSEVLQADSFPVRRVDPQDGYLESDWFDAATRRPTSARRLGSEVVRIRAWVDPARRGHSWITLETVYRPVADPSLDQRGLDTQVPPDHPVGKRVAEIASELARLYAPISAQ